MKITITRTLGLLACLAAGAGIVYAFIPTPVVVDTAEVLRGPMLVTVDDDGRTRIRDRYTVSSPLTGRVQRITLRAGDPVEAGATRLTTIAPADPSLLDARAVAEAEARVRRAEAALMRAGPERERARAQFNYTESELGAVRAAFDRGVAGRLELEAAELQHRAALELLNAAKFSEEIARFELDLARAALIRTKPESESDADIEHIEITAPVDGRVLRVFQESMAVVAPGTPLIEIGDPTDLELEIDVLSTDAVRVSPGARVFIERWGGDRVLEGRVRLVEPRAFTHISALGVEEQRVYIIADFIDPPEERPTLGDAYRIEARIVVWEADGVVIAPSSALFRHEGGWAVYTLDNSRARLRTVKVGQMTGLQTEILEGLEPGQRVIVHPGDDTRDGARVQPRS